MLSGSLLRIKAIRSNRIVFYCFRCSVWTGYRDWPYNANDACVQKERWHFEKCLLIQVCCGAGWFNLDKNWFRKKFQEFLSVPVFLDVRGFSTELEFNSFFVVWAFLSFFENKYSGLISYSSSFPSCSKHMCDPRVYKFPSANDTFSLLRKRCFNFTLETERKRRRGENWIYLSSSHVHSPVVLVSSSLDRCVNVN